MRPFLPLVLLVSLCGVSLLACSSEPQSRDPETLPYTLKRVRDLGTKAQAADLDGDGFDEVARNYTPSNRPPGVKAVLLQTHDGRTIEQANFEGQILPLHFLDLDQDGVLEILVPYLRNDSLYLGIVNAQGQKRGGFFLADGEPRVEPEGVLPWDPGIRNFHLADTDADGRSELVTVLQTRFARYPRGVLVHRLPEGQFVGKKLIGGAPTHSFAADLDGDGKQEVVVSTASPHNGAVAGGFDDAHSYAIVFELSPIPGVQWSKETGGLWTGTGVTHADFDGDGHRELLVYTTTASSKPEAARFEIVEPRTWQTVRHRSIAEPLRWAQTVDLDRDARPEIVAVREPDEVWVFDGDLERTQRSWVAEGLGELNVWPDIDGDGVSELAVEVGTGQLFLTPTLRVKASVSGRVTGVLRRGIGHSPYLLVEREERIWAMELVDNPLWWLYRYGPLALWVLGIIAVFGTVTGARSLYRRTQLLERVYPIAVDAAERGVLVLSADERVVLMNAVLCDWLGLGTTHPVRGERVGDVLSETPALAGFLRRALASAPPLHHDEEVVLGWNGQQHIHHARADPVVLDPGRPPYWVVTLAQGRRDAVYIDARLWTAVAEEVTHRLRNALGIIVQEAENLQAAYREQVPEVAGGFDPYTERIAERVEALRRETIDILSIHDVEALALTRADLSSVVRDAQDALERDRPRRAELCYELEDELPAVLVDRGQVQTALENLVANAFRAISGGGVVTVSTRSVSNLQRVRKRHGPADYVVLEVRDNGIGIAEANLRYLFEPGFTTKKYGTGFGLAFVQRVAAHHGGFVDVASEEGRGSTFSLYLPVVEDEHA